MSVRCLNWPDDGTIYQRSRASGREASAAGGTVARVPVATGEPTDTDQRRRDVSLGADTVVHSWGWAWEDEGSALHSREGVN